MKKTLALLSLLALSGCASKAAVVKPVSAPATVLVDQSDIPPTDLVKAANSNHFVSRNSNSTIVLPLDWKDVNAHKDHILFSFAHSSGSAAIIVAHETKPGALGDAELVEYLKQETFKTVKEMEEQEIPYRLGVVSSDSKGKLPALQYMVNGIVMSEVYIIKNKTLFSYTCSFREGMDKEDLSKALDGCAAGLESLEVK